MVSIKVNDRCGTEPLFQVLTERKEKVSVASMPTRHEGVTRPGAAVWPFDLGMSGT